MKRVQKYVILALCIVMAGVLAVEAQTIIERIMTDVWDSTNQTIRIEGNVNTPPVTVAAASYTLTSASKASDYLVDYTTTGAVSFIVGSSSIAVNGRKFTLKDVDANAGTNNITVSTEGSETIDGSATYAMNANSEAVTLISDGTNLHVVGGFAE